MKTVQRWWSSRTHQEMTLVRWGHFGRPVLLFPTAGGDAEEAERFHLIGALGELIADGRIKVYAVDSVAGRAWARKEDPLHCTWLQNAFHGYVEHEVLPAIRADCQSPDLEIITAGASLGAFNAAATLCRHPSAVRAAIGMSGTYDFEPWLKGRWTEDFYHASPMHFLPNLDGPQLAMLQHRFMLMAVGLGRWESPEQTWRFASVLGSCGIPNRVDEWGPEWDHDWPSWRRMLPQYLDELTR
jgi:esterase/lipase superfamily enzyme